MIAQVTKVNTSATHSSVLFKAALDKELDGKKYGKNVQRRLGDAFVIHLRFDLVNCAWISYVSRVQLVKVASGQRECWWWPRGGARDGQSTMVADRNDGRHSKELGDIAEDDR